MKPTKVICLLLILSFFLFNIPNITFANPEAKKVDVVIGPNLVNKYAEYIIRFPLNKPVKAGGWIKVIFPEGVELPVISNEKFEPGHNDSNGQSPKDNWLTYFYIGMPPIQCKSTFGYPEINYKERSIKFYLCNNLYPNNFTYIIIKYYAGIKNPKTPGKYVLKVSSSVELNPVESNKFDVIDAEISGQNGNLPSVEVDPPDFGAHASYKIRFKLGEGVKINKNLDRITLIFPQGMKMPSRKISDQYSDNAYSLPDAPIKINNKIAEYSINHDYSGMTYNNFDIIFPLNIEGGSDVLIDISKDFGLKNSLKPGQYNLVLYLTHSEASSYHETPRINTQQYTINNGTTPLEIDPSYAKATANYNTSIYLDKNEYLSSQNPLYILLPDSVKISNSNRIGVTFTINGNKYSTVTKIIEKNKMAVYPNSEIESNNVVDIVIPLINPDNSEIIKLGYKIGDEENWRYTKEFQIVDHTFRINNIGFTSQRADSISGYHISFILGLDKGLSKDDSIFIRFPEGTFIPDKISSTSISANDSYVKSINISGTKLEIKLNEEIIPGTRIGVHISDKAEIKNPIISNNYRLYVSTTNESEVYSEEYFIYAKKTISEIKLNIKEGKIGKEDWYITSPVLTLESEDPDARIFFLINSLIAIPYNNPIYLDGGQYKASIYYYSYSDKATNTDGNYKEISIDTEKPKIELKKLSKQKEISLKDSFNIEGNIYLPKTYYYGEEISLIDQIILINNNSVDFSAKDGSFSYNVKLNKGKNLVKVYAEDIAGNTDEKNLEIWYGYTITLKINSSKVIVNEEEITIDPPIISSGSSYSPLRLFEIIGAKISYTYDVKTGKIKSITIEHGTDKIILTVGSKQVLVNGKYYTLDSPALIIKDGIYYTILRFMVEILGCELKWDPKPQTITITYP
jgi:hypothetical protein